MTVQIAPVTNRLQLFKEQYLASFTSLTDRLQGLTDAEYFREPVTPCWNLRRAAEADPQAEGKGEWKLLQFEKQDDPAPFTTLAWRLCHLVSWQMIRCDYTFGSKSLTWNDIEYPGTAVGALTFLQSSNAAWLAGLDSLSESDLDTVGLSSNPWGYDPRLPFAEILWWTNREYIHHAAEICLLRDLYRYQ